jgi:hypothetical protein
MKTCNHCGKRKAISKFYEDRRKADGHFHQCKECVKQRVRDYTARNIEKTRACTRRSMRLPHRVEANKKAVIARMKERPEINRARQAVSRALKKGTIKKPKKCAWSKCTTTRKYRIEAHHEDYNKPLIVNWLCTPCHGRLHKGTTPEARAIQAIIVIPMAA